MLNIDYSGVLTRGRNKMFLFSIPVYCFAGRNKNDDIISKMLAVSNTYHLPVSTVDKIILPSYYVDLNFFNSQDSDKALKIYECLKHSCDKSIPTSVSFLSKNTSINEAVLSSKLSEMEKNFLVVYVKDSLWTINRAVSSLFEAVSVMDLYALEDIDVLISGVDLSFQKPKLTLQSLLSMSKSTS